MLGFNFMHHRESQAIQTGSLLDLLPGPTKMHGVTENKDNSNNRRNARKCYAEVPGQCVKRQASSDRTRICIDVD